MNKIFAPYKLCTFAPIYIFWLVFLFVCGLINLWAYVLLGDPGQIVKELGNGMIYTFAISTCTPFIAGFAIEIIDNKLQRNDTYFLTYKVSCILIDVIFTLAMTVLWLGKLKSAIVAQVIVLLITLAFSFYSFCVGEMSNHMDFFKEYDDKSYLDKEKNKMNKTSSQADSISGDDILNWRDSNEKNS